MKKNSINCLVLGLIVAGLCALFLIFNIPVGFSIFDNNQIEPSPIPLLFFILTIVSIVLAVVFAFVIVYLIQKIKKSENEIENR